MEKYSKFRELISKDRVDQVIDELLVSEEVKRSGHRNSIIILSNRLKKWRNERRNGLDPKDSEQAKVTIGMLEILDELERENREDIILPEPTPKIIEPSISYRGNGETTKQEPNKSSMMIMVGLIALVIGVFFSVYFEIIPGQKDSQPLIDVRPTENEEFSKPEPVVAEVNPKKGLATVKKESQPAPKQSTITLRGLGKDDEFNKIAFDHISNELTNQGLKLASLNRGTSDHELRFKVTVGEKTVEVIRTMHMIQFKLDITIFELSTNTAIKSYNLKSEEKVIYDKSDIPNQFADWVTGISGEFNSIKKLIQNK